MKEQNGKGRSPARKAKQQDQDQAKGTRRRRALRIACAERLDITLVRELHAKLRQALQERRPIIIDGARVEQADAAALQLLCALGRDAKKNRIKLQFKNSSRALHKAASLLGLEESLGLSPATGGGAP